MSISPSDACLIDPYIYDFRKSDGKLFSNKISMIASMSGFFVDDFLESLFYSNDCVVELMDAGAWPNHDLIKSLLSRHGIDFVSLKDIVGFINSIIEKSRLVEDAPCDDVDVTKYDFGESQDIVYWDAENVGFLDKSYRPFARHVHYMYRGEPSAKIIGHPAQGNDVVCVISYDRIDDDGVIISERGDAKLELYDLANLSPPALEGLELWRRADTPEKALAAVVAGAIEVAGGPVLDVSLGRDFFQSLSENQCLGWQPFSSVLYKLMVRLVTGGQVSGDKFMTNRNSVVLERNGFSARRCHITKGNPALRLLYWRRNDVVVLANVGPKNQLIIGSIES